MAKFSYVHVGAQGAYSRIYVPHIRCSRMWRIRMAIPRKFCLKKDAEKNEMQFPRMARATTCTGWRREGGIFPTRQ